MISSSDMASLYASSTALLWFLFCERVSPCLFHFVDGPTCVSPSTGCVSGSGFRVQSSMVISPHPRVLVSCSRPLPLPLGLGWSLLLLSFELMVVVDPVFVSMWSQLCHVFLFGVFAFFGNSHQCFTLCNSIYLSSASNSLQLLYGSCVILPVSHWTSNSTELPECL